ncbi:MAG: hypothetical protein NZ518_10940, partial [Dehalococcoidia bacterium]|nr:hypothetical protein [Dehalococcoidia bacterium]
LAVRTPPAIVPTVAIADDARLVVVEEAAHRPSPSGPPVVVGPRRPSAVAEMAAWRLAHGAISPVEPVYLRAPQISEPRSR